MLKYSPVLLREVLMYLQALLNELVYLVYNTLETLWGYRKHLQTRNGPGILDQLVNAVKSIAVIL